MNAPRHINDPRPGFFLVRKVRRGPLVPARIWRPCHCTINGEDEHAWRDTCDRYPGLSAEIDGFPVEIDQVWHYGKEVDEQEFNYRTEATAWDKRNDPDAPAANPDQPIDLMTVKPPF